MNTNTPAMVARYPLANRTLEEIERLDRCLEERFRDKFLLQASLNRQLVSFQANKSRPIFRWFRYKEEFSAGLIESLLSRYHVNKGRILDPFGGSGAALFVASKGNSSQQMGQHGREPLRKCVYVWRRS